MAKRTWVAKMNCQMPFRDFLKGESVELDDNEVTARVKALFECVDKPVEKKSDPDFNVMVARLRAAKIPIPRGANKEKVSELFNAFLAKGTLAQNISGDVSGDNKGADAPKGEGDKPTEGEVAGGKDAGAGSGEGGEAPAPDGDKPKEEPEPKGDKPKDEGK